MATAVYGGLIMLKKIEYETKDINEVVLDLADEIKLGWRLQSFGWPSVEYSSVEYSVGCHPKITAEVTLSKEN